MMGETDIFEHDGYMKRAHKTRITGPDGLTTEEHRAEMASLIRTMARHNRKGQLLWASFYAAGDA
jgi:hypothetical protein